MGRRRRSSRKRPKRTESNGNYRTRGGTHIAFGKKRSITITFHRATRKAKHFRVIVSRFHVHVIRSKHHRAPWMGGKRGNRRRRRKGNRRRRRGGQFY